MKKITKILTLGILFLFVFTLQLSAQKCKYDYNKKDPITDEATKGNTITLSTFAGGFSVGPACKIGFNRKGDSFHLGMLITYRLSTREYIQKGDPIVFKLSNGDVVTVYSQDEYSPVAQASQGVIFSQYFAKYSLDASTLQKIAENAPTFVRINIGSMVFEKEIAAKNGKEISQAAACILQ
jgi:hypothetical protein